MASVEKGSQGNKSKTIDQLKQTVNMIDTQLKLIETHYSQWLRHVIDLQKNMVYKLDLFRGLEEELNLEKKLILDIINSDLAGNIHIVDAISEIQDSASSSLDLIEKMKTTDDPKLIPEIMSATHQFRGNLLNYIEYLDFALGSRGGKSLEALKIILEDKENMEQQNTYIIKEKNSRLTN